MKQHIPPAVAAGNSNGRGWLRVNRELPCPVCGGHDNCNITPDGAWCWCGRVPDGSIRENDGGQFLHRLTEGDDDGMPPDHREWLERERERRAAQEPEPDEPAEDWPSLADNYFADSAGQRQQLASELGVRSEVLESLCIGHDGQGWTIPERSGDGRIIGIGRRFPDGAKAQMAGGKRGLVYCRDWRDDTDGPVILPEGASCTAAALTMGLCAIGRPSNTGGVRHLAEMLRGVPEDRAVIVMAERDVKDDGTWPGRTGAIGTATALARELKRRVAWAFPPDGAKDVRDWLQQHGEHAEFAGRLNLQVVEPEDTADEPARRIQFLDMSEVVQLDLPVVDGLFRIGETCNIIAPPKSGKSWLSYGIAYSVLYGLNWLEHECEQGDVLLIDNELRPNTLRHRLHTVYSTLHEQGHISDPWTVTREKLNVVSLRGRLVDINALAASMIQELEAGRYRMVVIDALYRTLPAGASENDNATMAQIYNTIDQVAESLGVAIVVIHHSSKGNQSGKSVVDVGAGAGSVSRAADAHLVLREHETDGVFVLESKLRSFAPAEPVCATFDWPLWRAADGFDPNKLKQQSGGKSNTDKEAEFLTALQRLGKPANLQSVRSETSMSGDQAKRTAIRLHNAGRVACLDAKTLEFLQDVPEGKRVVWSPVNELTESMEF